MINFNLKAFVVALIAAHACCVQGCDETFGDPMLEGIEHTVLNGSCYRVRLQSLTNDKETKQWIGQLNKFQTKRIDRYLQSFSEGENGDYTGVLDALLLAVDEGCSLRQIKSAFSKLVSGVAQEDDKAMIIYSCLNALKKGSPLEYVASVVASLIPLFEEGLTDLDRSEFMDVFVELFRAPNMNRLYWIV